MGLLYRLEGRIPVHGPDPQVWVNWFERAYDSGERVVALDQVGKTVISTVFLGINQFYAEPPILFETVIREPDGTDGSYLVATRYASWEDAEEGHRLNVAVVRREQAEMRA